MKYETKARNDSTHQETLIEEDQFSKKCVEDCESDLLLIKNEENKNNKSNNEVDLINPIRIAWIELKSAPRELYLIFLLKFLESYSYFAMIYTLILFLSDEFKYSDEQAGWAYGIFGMCISLYGFIFGGFLIDNLGVKKSLSLGCLILCIGRFMLVVSNSHTIILIILYSILPIGTCLGIPVMQIGIRRYTTENSRSLAYSIFYAMMNISAIFSASAIDFFRRNIADETIEIMNMKFDICPYRVLFLSGSIATLISFLISVFLIREYDIDKKEEEHSFCEESQKLISEIEKMDEKMVLIAKGEACALSKVNNTSKKIKSPLEIMREVMSQQIFWKFACLILLLMGVRMVFRHLDATFPKYMIREFGKEFMYGSIIAINPFLIVVLIPLFAPLSYQFSAFNQIIVGSFITTISPFFLAYGPHLWSCVMFVIMLSIGEALWSPRLYEYTIFITEKGREGIYMALASSPMFIATLATGATSGWLLESFCPEKGVRQSWKMWFIIGLVTLLSPILLLVFKNKIEVTTQDLEIERKRRLQSLREKAEHAKNYIENIENDIKSSNNGNTSSRLWKRNDLIIQQSEEFKIS